MNKYPMKPFMDEMATHGRYGDTMLVHMNPAEVEGIASLVPGGKLTINPVTGQPEAFLQFLAPLLGSMGGSALAASGALGTTLAANTALASAIGSGLATTAVTGDLKKGLLSGIMGYGLGQGMDAAKEAVAGVETAKGIGTTGLEEGLSSSAIPATAEQIAAKGMDPSLYTAVPDKFAGQTLGELANVEVSPIMDRVGGFASGMTDAKAFIPTTIGGSMLAEDYALDDMRAAAKKAEEEDLSSLQATENTLYSALSAAQPGTMRQFQNPYQYSAEGGIVSLAEGGNVPLDPQIAAARAAYEAGGVGGALDFTKAEQDAITNWYKTNYPNLFKDQSASAQTADQAEAQEPPPPPTFSTFYDQSRGFYGPDSGQSDPNDPLSGIVGLGTGMFGLGGYRGLNVAGPNQRSIAIQQGLRGRYHSAPPKG